MNKLDYFIDILGQIKDLPRSGWLQKKVENSESAADHSFGVALLTLLLAPDHLDRDKCLRLAVIHDLAEAKIGDYTPFDGISREEKHRLETEVQGEIAQKSEHAELAALFSEYEDNQTPEARFVHDVDRLEAVLQAKYYDDNRRSAQKLMPEFTAYAEKHLNEDNGIVAELLKKVKKSAGL